LLIRNFASDLHDHSYRNIVLGLMFGNVPSVNPLASVLMGMDRPLLHGAMLNIRSQLRLAGELEKKKKKEEEAKKPTDNSPSSSSNPNDTKESKVDIDSLYKYDFPVIPMRYLPNTHTDRTAGDAITMELGEPEYPLVMKVGTTHAGFGKTRIANKSDMDDFRSIMALNKQYYTTEAMVENVFEYRIQKIGKHYRGFKRVSDNSWKNNWGNLKFEDHKLEEFDIMWADRCSNIFGGLDIFALDVLVRKDGTRVILEINDGANGLMYQHEKEDLGHIRDLVIERMNTLCV